jgi:hypothetical protein
MSFMRDGAIPKVPALWHVLIEGLNPIWPTSRTTLHGVALGDVWPCTALTATTTTPVGPDHDLVPFHKLTGYSLIEPIECILHWKFVGIEDMVGLPEYRNGPFYEALAPPLLIYRVVRRFTC